MVERIKNGNPTRERFVAFLDIMGFKYKLQTEGHEKILKMFDSLRPTFDRVKDFSQWMSKNKRPKVKLIKFSDSIILVSDDDSKYSFEWTLFDTQFILYNALINGIPIKGAIAFGTQTDDFKSSFHFGQPLLTLLNYRRS